MIHVCKNMQSFTIEGNACMKCLQKYEIFYIKKKEMLTWQGSVILMFLHCLHNGWSYMSRLRILIPNFLSFFINYSVRWFCIYFKPHLMLLWKENQQFLPNCLFTGNSCLHWNIYKGFPANFKSHLHCLKVNCSEFV